MDGSNFGDENIGVFDSPIRSIYFDIDHSSKVEKMVIVGLENGEIRVLALDNDYLRIRNQIRLREIGIFV